MQEKRTTEHPPGARGAGADTERALVVELAGVTKRFGEFVAVDDLSLDIYEGEFFSLLGPSGCGKTTTLRMIAGFDEPTEGGISVAGEQMRGVPPYRRPVNTVFQSYAIFPHLNVFDNVAFGLKRAGVQKDEIRQRVTEAGEMVQLAGFEKRHPNMLGRAGEHSGSRSRGRSSTARRCCSGRASGGPRTSSSGRSCSSSSGPCSTRSGSPSSTSRTTRKRRSR